MIVLFLAVSLSMDAFSLSLAYGTLGLNKNEIIKLATIVGIYHFIMPLIGHFSGKLILKLIPISEYLLVFIVLLLIGLNMIIESFGKREIKKKVSNFEYLIFGLAVSLDSFSVGMGLKAITNNYLLAPFLFSITSFAFTLLGLVLGKKINELIGKIATILGGIFLIILGIIYVI